MSASIAIIGGMRVLPLLLLILFCAGCPGDSGGDASLAPAELAIATPPSVLDESAPGLESDSERYAEDRFFHTVDQFLSADRPEMVLAADADFMEIGAEVLGFVIKGESRAYDLKMVCYHHVVNDVIAETPIAVTY